MARKTVAVFISGLYEDMVRVTAEGLIASAAGNDAKVLFFTSFTDNVSSKRYARYRDYDTGDFVAFLLPKLDQFDGLITFDTYMPISYQEPVDRIKARAACPVITLGTVKRGTWSVVNDQDRSMREIIEHLIVRHGCRDIVHAAGRIEMTFSRERIAIFKDTLTRHGLPCDDDRIVYGDLSPNCGERLVGEILARYEGSARRAPDAIVCVNDFTAIGVIRALEKRGFRVPEDVIVTGYDDVLRAEFNEPSITTSAQPFYDVGRTGMDLLAELWRGEWPEPVVAVPGLLKCRQSCGCEPFGLYKKDAIREKYITTVSRLESLVQSNTNLILGAAADETVEDIFDEIEDGCLRETGFQDAVLCLLRDWDSKKIIADEAALQAERFDVACGVWHGQPVARGPLPEGALMPREMMDDPAPLFIFPVHHLQYFMGYFVVNPVLKHMGQLHIKSWLVSISTVLENWRIRRQLMQSVRQLDHLHQTDMLTGLYNRRGYYRFFDQYYRQCREEHAPLAVLLIDMNHMKAVNDTYGHAEGDFCLRAIADAMRACAGERDICVRSGGDEFVVLSPDCDSERAEASVRGLRAALVDACAREGKPYTVTVSVGCHIRTPDVVYDEAIRHAAEDYIRRADSAMYEEKQRR